jgi:hypothetical protein
MDKKQLRILKKFYELAVWTNDAGPEDEGYQSSEWTAGLGVLSNLIEQEESNG